MRDLIVLGIIICSLIFAIAIFKPDWLTKEITMEEKMSWIAAGLMFGPNN